MVSVGDTSALRSACRRPVAPDASQNLPPNWTVVMHSDAVFATQTQRKVKARWSLFAQLSLIITQTIALEMFMFWLANSDRSVFVSFDKGNLDTSQLVSSIIKRII